MVSRYVKQEKIWEHGAILEENKYHPGDPWYNKAANMHEATMLSMYLLWFLKLVQFLLSLVMYTLPLEQWQIKLKVQKTLLNQG